MKENLSNLAASEDWIHAKPLVGVEGRGGVGLHPFCFVVPLFDPPSPLFFSYLGLVLSTSRLRNRMSRNSSLESPGLSGVYWE